MICSNDFIWLHFPKCAGSKVETIFKTYFLDDATISQDLIDRKMYPGIDWHHSISERKMRDPDFKVGNREVICSFRRLPAWLISRFNYEVARSPKLEHKPELLLKGLFTTATGKQLHADKLISRYLGYGDIAGKRVSFLRTENFEQDFKNIFGKYVDISRVPERVFKVKENASPSNLDRNIREKLMAGDAYRFCPAWGALEYFVYDRCGKENENLDGDCN